MGANVTKQNQDIAFKFLVPYFKGKSLEFLGLDAPPIRELVSTNLPAIEASDRNADLTFLLNNDTLLHLEFQITKDKGVLERFVLYNFRFIRSIVERSTLWLFTQVR